MTQSAMKVHAPQDNAWAANDARIRSLRESGVPMSVTWGDDGAVIDAYVTSAEATRLLAPLGRKAIGKFRAMPGNMVAIEAIVSHPMAMKMLEARCCTA